MPSQRLTKWQRFKIWTSRYFGCASSYSLKNSEPVKGTNNGNKFSTNKISTEQVDNALNKEHDDGIVTSAKNHQVLSMKLEKSNPNSQNESSNIETANHIERSFSKDSENIPFIDASTLNLPQAVKQ